MAYRLRYDWTPPVPAGAVFVRDLEDEADGRIVMNNTIDAWPANLRAIYLVRPDGSIILVLTLPEVEQWKQRQAAQKATAQAVSSQRKETLS